MVDQPVIIYPQSEEELRDKLVNVTLELETMKNVKDGLFDSLMLAYRERDEAIFELQKLMNKPMATATITNIFGSVQNEHNPMFSVTKANSSITESNTLSHGSPTVDSFFDIVSSPEFPNIINNNLSYSYLSQNLVQDMNNSSVFDDAANAIIDSLSKVRGLPEKGKLVEAVIDAGPLLQNVIFAGPIPIWRNPPPPLEHIKIPPLTIKVNDSCSNISTYLKPKVPSNAYLSTSSCSSSMLNFAGHHLRKRQRHQ